MYISYLRDPPPPPLCRFFCLKVIYAGSWLIGPVMTVGSDIWPRCNFILEINYFGFTRKIHKTYAGVLTTGMELGPV
jgi:hypothetical protein